jgi:hypothetical protein
MPITDSSFLQSTFAINSFLLRTFLLCHLFLTLYFQKIHRTHKYARLLQSMHLSSVFCLSLVQLKSIYLPLCYIFRLSTAFIYLKILQAQRQHLCKLLLHERFCFQSFKLCLRFHFLKSYIFLHLFLEGSHLQ